MFREPGPIRPEDAMAEPMTETASARCARLARRCSEAPSQVAERFGEGKNTAAREALGIARALRNTADQLERQSQGSIAGYARSAANVVERIGESLERKSPSQMLNDVERICREHPAAGRRGRDRARLPRRARSQRHARKTRRRRDGIRHPRGIRERARRAMTDYGRIEYEHEREGVAGWPQRHPTQRRRGRVGDQPGHRPDR